MRKVFVCATLAMLVFSLVAINAHSEKATIHVQTFGYEGRDVLKLNLDIAGENSDYLYVTLNPGMLNKISKEINVEKLPITESNGVYAIPKAYLTEIASNEYMTLVPNDVTRIKWNLKDKIAGMKGNELVDIIVMYKGVKNPAMLKKHGQVTYEFLSGLGASMTIRAANIKALSEEPGVLFLEDDAIIHVALSSSVPLINADDVWAMGYDGTGITICIVDTGIDPNHCDFPSGKIVAWADYVGSGSTPYDDHGHGTHCASIAAGETSAKGVAPGASLMGAKVLNSSGSGTTTAIINGIDFGVAQGADIESLSLGGSGGDGTSALAQECNWAVGQGVVMVIAAGNSGSSCCTIGTPGDAADVITVGASDKSDALASFSSRGPTTDGRIKPDITAPGVSIYAADAGTSCSDVAMSGTSMATPHMAGVCALMLDARGSATPSQVKNCIGATAIDKGNTGKDCLWGWGRVDAYAAVNQIISNPSVSPPADGDCGCECGGTCLGTAIISALVLLGAAIRRR